MGLKVEKDWDFLGGPAVRTLHFHCRGHGFIPGQRLKIHDWELRFCMWQGVARKKRTVEKDPAHTHHYVAGAAEAQRG